MLKEIKENQVNDKNHVWQQNNYLKIETRAVINAETFQNSLSPSSNACILIVVLGVLLYINIILARRNYRINIASSILV